MTIYEFGMGEHKYSDDRKCLSCSRSGWLCWQMLAGDRHRTVFLGLIKRCWTFLDPRQWELLPFQKTIWKQFLSAVLLALLLPSGLASDPTYETNDIILDMSWVHASGWSHYWHTDPDTPVLQALESKPTVLSEKNAQFCFFFDDLTVILQVQSFLMSAFLKLCGTQYGT